jgi:uncharacterized protein
VDLEAKRAHLEDILATLRRTLVAYSGGVDSAFLAWAAHRVLQNNMLAVLADSPSLARSHLRDAIAFAQENSIPLEIVHTAEMARPEYVRNDLQRCFHCKDELFQVMGSLARQRGFESIAYGVNLDDLGDFRPGQTAARQHRVATPLLDARLAKAEVRELAQRAGLRVWDKPASACLSSRVEYGRPITEKALSAIEQGEDALKALGFRQVRVRHHGEVARIEIAKDELERALTLPMLSEFTRIFKGLGFAFVSLDTEGFRSGSMNTGRAVQPLVKLLP